MRKALADIKSTSGSSDAEAGEGNAKRGESLGALSRKFVSLFLDSEDGTVLSLESAASGMQRRDTTPDRQQGATKTKGSASVFFNLFFLDFSNFPCSQCAVSMM